MIRWLLRLIGIAPRIAPERRRSLVERLNDPESPENSTMVRAQAALERHRRREEAIAAHQAEVDAEKAQGAAKRKGHQSEIAESTISLNRVRRKTDALSKSRVAAIKRKQERNPNPFSASELVKRDRERRNEA